MQQKDKVNRCTFFFLLLMILIVEMAPRVLAQSENLVFAEQPEGRALWVTRWEYRTEARVREIIRDAKDAHLNIILFQVRGQADAFYFSNYEPWSDILGGSYPGFDPLAVAIDEAHRNGLELHAYLNTFPVWTGTSPPSSPNHIYNSHPEWIMVNSSGIPMDPAAAGYATGSPGIPEFTDHVFNVFMDVLENYDVDGLHMDYIRYPGTSYSYDSTSVARFKQETGLSSPYVSPYQWAQWRRDQVSNFVYRIYEGTMSRKPWVKVSAAVWGSYYNGYNNVLQDPRDWLSKGKIDFIAPMTYTDNMSTYQSWVNNHARSTWGRHVYAGIDISGYLDTDDEALQQVDICRLVQTQGSAFFSAGALDNSLILRLATDPYVIVSPAPPMDWKLNPVISHQPLTDTENTTIPYTITAKIQSPVPLVADSLLVVWSSSPAFDEISVELFSQINDSTFEAAIPPQVNEDIFYYLLAKNEQGYVAKLPQWGPVNYFSFYAGPDVIAPVLSFEPTLVNSFYPIDSLDIILSVTDNIGLDSNSVFVHYFLNDEIEDSLKLVNPAPFENFAGQIEFEAIPGDTLFYYFSANDLSSQINRAETELFSISIGLENFENGQDGWLADDGWFINSEQALSGKHSLKFALPQDFGANATSVFVTSQPVSLQRLEFATLHLWSRFVMEADLLVGRVDVSEDDGATWQSVGQELSGFVGQWTEFYFPLTQYCGQGKPEILIRIRAQSIADPGQEQLEWFIDDISIKQDLARVAFDESQSAIPKEYSLLQNYPNPFNSNTIIRFGINISEPLPVTLKIFDIRGREVLSLFNEELTGGNYTVTWNGHDWQNQQVTSGIYFYELKAGSFKQVRKMTLIR